MVFPVVFFLAAWRILAGQLVGNVVVKGIINNVEIKRGNFSIPDIYADNYEDAMYGIGYAQGQDRLWQLDVTRRIATGTLSEIIGEKALDVDIFARNIKIPILAQRDVDAFTGEGKKFLQAYVDGINQSAKDQNTPIEYYLTWSQWKDFSLEDTQSILYLTNIGLSGTWGTDILRHQLKKFIGDLTFFLLPSDVALIRPISFIISNLELSNDLKFPTQAEETVDLAKTTIDLTEETINLGAKTIELTEEKIHLTEEKIDSEKKIDLEKEKVKVTEVTIDLTEKISDLAEETADLTEETADLTEENQDLSEEILDLTEENLDLTEETADLTEETADLTEDPEDLAEELGDLTEAALDSSIEEALVLTEESLDSVEEIIDIFIDSDDMGSGSNGWAISGKHTLSGKPILANDPHLPSQTPSVWYPLHVHLKDNTISGFTTVGSPLIVSGRNKYLSWIPTSLKPDIIDIFIEKIIGTQYLYGEEMKDLQTFEEKIIVRGSGVQTYQFSETIHGPILAKSIAGARKVSSTMPDTTDTNLSFCWSVYAFTDGSSVALEKFVNARTVYDIREALSHLTSLNMAMLSASTSGDIAFHSSGRIPIRKGLGDVPLSGWIPSNTWSGYIPFEEMPYVVNPEKGFIVMANNMVTGPDYKYFQTMGRYFSHGRSERITEIIQEQIDSGKKFTASQQLKIQNDELNIFARETLPNLLSKVKLQEKHKKIFADMKKWDFVMGKDSVVAGVYALWQRNLARNLLVHRVPKELIDTYLKSLIMQLSLPFFFEDWYPSLESLCDNPKTKNIETCGDLISESFAEACEEISDNTWGDIHVLQSDHIPLSKVPILSKFFGLKEKIGGMYPTIHAMHYIWGDKFRCNMGPGMSIIMDLGDPSENYWKIETGVSGNPFSQHYDDMFKFFHSEQSIKWTFN